MTLYTNLPPGMFLAASLIFPILCIGLIGARLLLRKLKYDKLTADDWLTLPALLFLIGIGAASTYGVAEQAVAYPTPTVQPAYDQKTSIINGVYLNSEWLQSLSLGFAKLSFVCMCRRLSNTPGQIRLFNITSMITIALLSVWMVSFCLAILLSCGSHLSAFWAAGPMGRVAPARAEHCYPMRQFYYAYCWSDVGFNVALIMMPIPMIKKLKLNSKRKLAVTAVFILGAVTIGITIIRAVMYLDFLPASPPQTTSHDQNMQTSNALYWILLETGLTLIAANLPALYLTSSTHDVQLVARHVASRVSLRSDKSSSKSRSSHEDIVDMEKMAEKDGGSRLYDSASVASERVEDGGAEEKEMSANVNVNNVARWSLFPAE